MASPKVIKLAAVIEDALVRFLELAVEADAPVLHETGRGLRALNGLSPNEQTLVDAAIQLTCDCAEDR